MSKVRKITDNPEAFNHFVGAFEDLVNRMTEAEKKRTTFRQALQMLLAPNALRQAHIDTQINKRTVHVRESVQILLQGEQSTLEVLATDALPYLHRISRRVNRIAEEKAQEDNINLLSSQERKEIDR